MPEVSVILPTYNRVHFLPRAIGSVLAQTFSDLELLIVDNGSTDGTEKVVSLIRQSDLRIRYLVEPKKGTSHARNRGLKEAKGKWIAFLDDDDEWLPEKLSRQLDFFESHPETGLLYTQARMKNGKGDLVGLKPSDGPARGFSDLIDRNSIPTLTVMVRRDCIEKAGHFDTAIQIVEDYDLWLRISREFPIRFLPEPLAIYHRHGKNLSTQPLWRYQNTILIFKKLIESPQEPLDLERIKRRLVFLHHQLARGYIFLNELSQARRTLKEERSLIHAYPFPGQNRLLLKSWVLSTLLMGPSWASRVLRRRWQRRENSHFPEALKGKMS